MILESSILCLALNVYFEARGESEKGMQAIAQVTYNRAKVIDSDNPKSSICEAVYQKNQFSWTKKNPKSKLNNIIKKLEKSDDESWIEALELAKKFKPSKLTITHFHSIRVRPSWSKGRSVILRVGDHKFYSIYEELN